MWKYFSNSDFNKVKIVALMTYIFYNDIINVINKLLRHRYLMHEFKSYIKKVTGIEIVDLGVQSSALNRLPLFIREGYNYFCAEFHKQDVVFAEPKSIENATPSQLQKHIAKIEFAFECPIVFVFNEMTYYLKEQLIESRIAFVLPDKQLFIPFMFMDLNEQQKMRTTRRESFSPSTQCILIYHLWMGSLEGLNFQEIADIFQYTPRTIGRCAEELKNVDACSIVGEKSKYLKFVKTKREIWETAQDYLKSPVKKTEWLFPTENIEKARIAGLGALSYYSNISANKIETLAIDANEFNVLKGIGKIHPILDNKHDVRLEIWSYDPTVLTRNDFVDPFSLYLSSVNDIDERIQVEIENMINRVL
jgi:hypothetical protein